MAQNGTKIRYPQFKGRSGTDPDVVGPRTTIAEVIATAEAYEAAKRTEQSKERRKPSKGRTADSRSSESEDSSGTDTDSSEEKIRKSRKKKYRPRKKCSSSEDTSSEESEGSYQRARKVKTRDRADIDTLTKELADLKVQIATPKDKRRDPKAPRPKVNFVDLPSTSGAKNDVPVHLMTWEKPLTATTTTENNQQGLAREPKVVRFDPRVLEVTPIAASGSEGWPSDKEWTVNALSTRSKKDLIIVPSTREQRKKAKRSRKKDKKVDVASITSSDEPVDTTPLKYKDDSSHVIKKAIEGKLLAESSSKVPEPKEVVEPKFTSAVMTTVSVYHNLAETVSKVTTKSLEEECFTRPNSATWKQDPHHASAITISSFFIECYEADDTELASFDNEVRTLFISGMEAIGENAERKDNSSSHSKTEITSSNSAGVLTPDNPNQSLKLHQVWQSEEEPSAEEIPTREDEVVGATTFQTTEGMIPPGHHISIKGTEVAHEKVAIIVELQPPSCVRDKDDKGHDHPIYFSGVPPVDEPGVEASVPSESHYL
ncbi:hypothetical protein R1sor_014000 [Riccia sorocarpa]|uniref:Uncharacterized protein n=1 Tax=Riccia sorocarpa TaxID=122646 RepID=A0ABD3HA32_9MARC